jgi:hypothetical protein
MVQAMSKVVRDDTENLIRSLVRSVISLGGHGIAAYLMFRGSSAEPADIPEWLTGVFALVITWYFATNERTGAEKLPRWQAVLRSLVRSAHAIGGGAIVSILFIKDIEIPQWWVAIYVSILTFYFIELREPPPEVS